MRSAYAMSAGRIGPRSRSMWPSFHDRRRVLLTTLAGLVLLMHIGPPGFTLAAAGGHALYHLSEKLAEEHAAHMLQQRETWSRSPSWASVAGKA